MPIITGTSGNDVITDVSSPTQVFTSDDLDKVNGLAGNDIISTLGAADLILGGIGDDKIEGGADNDRIDGGSGNDWATYADSLAGVNVMLGNGSASRLQFGTVTFGAPGQTVTCVLGGGDATRDILISIENLLGSDFNDNLFGNTGANRLFGGLGDDFLQGLVGNDIVEGGVGNDILNGGAGNGALDILAGVDWVSYVTSALAVTVDLNLQGTSTKQSGGDAQGDLLFNFDNILGSANADELKGDNNDNVIEGGAAGDLIDGGGGYNTASYWGALAGVTVDLNLATQIGTSDENGDKLTNINNLYGSEFDDFLAGKFMVQGGVLRGFGGDDLLKADEDYTLDGGEDDDTADLSAFFGIAGFGISVTLAPNGALTNVYQEDVFAGKNPIYGKLLGIENIIGTVGPDRITGNNLNNHIDPNGGFSFVDGGGNEPAGGMSRPTGDKLILVAYTGGVSVDMSQTSKAFAGYYEVFENTSFFSHQVYFKNIENIKGTDQADEIIGNAVANWLLGDLGADILKGGKGNDEIQGGDDLVADDLDGEIGIDTLSYRWFSTGITAQLVFGSAVNFFGTTTDIAVNFENIRGTSQDDELIGDIQNNLLWGGRGNDKLSGFEGNDSLWGGRGDDTLLGDLGTDKLDGDGDNDTVDYSAIVNANLGFTVTLADPGKTAKVTGLAASGPDKSIAVGDGMIDVENLIGGAGHDVIVGNALANILFGGAGDDVIQGRGGGDTLDGGEGGETNGDTLSFSLSAFAVTVSLNPSADGGDATGDTIVDESFENLVGSAKDDVLRGDEFANRIDGGKGDDVIKGGASGDILIGGLGIDTLNYSEDTKDVKVTLVTGKAAIIVGDDHAKDDTATGFENLIGSASADELTGDTGNNVIEGGAGGDTLDGGKGINTLSYASDATGITLELENQINSGGDADGDIIAWTTFQNVIGGSKDDWIIGDAAANVIKGGDGKDIIGGGGIGPAKDTLLGEGGDDELTGFGTLDGGVGKDKLTGNGTLIGGDDDDTLFGVGTLLGGAGNDAIETGGGVASIDGGAGTDSLSYATAGGGVTVALGVYDVATGNSAQSVGKGADAAGDKIKNIEDLVGGFGNDVLTGNAGDNKFDGEDGDDTLQGGGGADTLDGGGDNDTLSYAASKLGVTVDLLAGTASGGDADGDTITGFENLLGSGKDDILTGNDEINKINGGLGNDLITGGLEGDQLIGGTGSDTANYAASSGGISINLSKQFALDAKGNINLATKGAELGSGFASEALGDALSGFENVIGTDFADELTGDKNANIIEGSGGGSDMLLGGLGIDTVAYTGSAAGVTVKLFEQGTTDKSGAILTTGGEQKGGDAEGDFLWGFENITGSSKDDLLFGDSGVNILRGGDGADTLNGGAKADTLDGGDGIDTADYSGIVNTKFSITVALAEGDKAVKVTGTAGSDAVGDTLIGVENVIGGAGNDLLNGNTEVNIFTGGGGNDIFRYDNVNEGGDELTDFTSGADKISIVKAGFGIGKSVNTATFQAEYFVDGTTPAANQSHGQFLFDTDDFQLFWDADGNGGGGAVLIAVLQPGAQLLATDFELK